MALRSLPLITLIAVVACTTTDPGPAASLQTVTPLVHPLDATAPIAFRQWPMQFLGCVANGPASYGGTMHIWRDHAVLTLDKRPLFDQLKRVRAGTPAARAAKRMRVSRWTVTSETCPALPSLYNEVKTIVPVHSPPELRLGVSPILELAIDGRFIAFDEFDSYNGWIGRTWQALYACATGPDTLPSTAAAASRPVPALPSDRPR